MCMPHQKPAKAQTRDIRGNKKEYKKIVINRQEFEKGDKNFIDERTSIIQAPQKKRGFHGNTKLSQKEVSLTKKV